MNKWDLKKNVEIDSDFDLPSINLWIKLMYRSDEPWIKNILL